MAYHGPIETSLDASTKPSYEGLESRLKRLSSYFPLLINTKDFSLQSPEVRELASHISADWTATMDTQPDRTPWKEQLVRWEARSNEMPNVRFDVKNMEIDLNNKRGVATVWVEMEVTGMGDVVLGAMNEVMWRRVDDRWECTFTRGMRGSAMRSVAGYET